MTEKLTESLQYISRCSSQDGLILMQNLADILHVQDLLLKCPNPAPWDSQLCSLPSPIILSKYKQKWVTRTH
jgi:hypothetical protein